MIFVTLGTQDKQFVRLLKAVEDCIRSGDITEEVIVQSGRTDYESDLMKVVKLIPQDQFEKYVSECSLLITHGGVGSIMTGLKAGKKVIAAPRLMKNDEHESDHQIQIVSEFVRRGNVLAYNENDSLAEVLKKVKDFEPNKYESNTSNMIRLIEDFIRENS